MKFLFDFFPILLFLIAYKMYDMYTATAVVIGATFMQNLLFWLKHRRFEKMHLITLALITVLGGATLLLQDRAFFMWKPTAVYWLFALAFLGSHFIGDKPFAERMMGHTIEVPKVIWKRLNVSWFAFFGALGIANIYVANFYMQAEQALFNAAGKKVDIDQCDALGGQLLELCQHAKLMEQEWVAFKVYWGIGLMFLFIIAQGFYLARHMPEQANETVNEESEG
ncbi:MAG: septation protein IspZ [Chromatiales bacterium]|nr:septation protein IspZ [Chromatiales bacterium]